MSNNINQIANALSALAVSDPKKPIKSNEAESSVITDNSADVDVLYEKNTDKEVQAFKPDMEKIKSMKAETDQRMIELFTKTVSNGYLKQLGGLRGALEKVLKGEKVEGLDISVTEESIKKAQEDIAPGGYWSPEKTSDRFLEFAKALSGDDPSKADKLINAFKKGYEQAAKLWGGELPEISKKTYDLTMEKFEAWKNPDKDSDIK